MAVEDFQDIGTEARMGARPMGQCSNSTSAPGSSTSASALP